MINIQIKYFFIILFSSRQLSTVRTVYWEVHHSVRTQEQTQERSQPNPTSSTYEPTTFINTQLHNTHGTNIRW